ncbi:TRAP transporter permease [Chloroflexota bacterium]
MREKNKALQNILNMLCAATSVYYLYVFFSGTITPMRQMAPLLTVGLIMAFLSRPVSTRLPSKVALSIDCLLVALSVFVAGFMIALEQRFEMLWIQPTGMTWFVASAIILLIMEATRRVLGWPLVIIVLFFMFYALFGDYVPGAFWHGGVSWGTLVYTVSLSVEGIWGIPIRVAATIVVLFLIFAAFLRVGGAADLFLSMSQSAFGRMRGGPAKMAVVASSLFGTISGSGVANVASTGVITIPLMKRTGYPPHLAGAIEALSSTGGQIMPPIMGAAAFIMAEFLGVSYWTICIAAFLPSVLYYISLFVMVDFEAAKMGMKGLPREEIPDLKPILRRGGHVILPLIVLVVCLGAIGLSVATSALYAMGSLWVISFVNKSTWITPGKFYQALVEGIKDMTTVTIACGIAAVLMGLVAATNLGMNLSGILIDFAAGNLFVLLVLSAMVGLILGMGMTTTAIYIFLAILIAPALVKMGVPVLAAHIFILWYGVVHLVTPPFCLASYVAAGIADAPVWKTAWAASYRGIILYIVPFMIVYDQSLILQGDPVNIILAFVTSIIGVCGLVSAVEGYAFVGPTRGILHRLLFGIGGLAMIMPGIASDLIGIALLALAVIPIYLRRKTNTKEVKAM